MESSTTSTIKVTIENGISDRTEFTFVDRFRIGRHPSCQLRINHQEVSRYHADVFIEDSRWWIQDLQSTNGVFIGDRKIDKSPLSGTIRIRLGLSGPLLLFEPERAVQPEPPAAPSHTLRDYIQHYFSEKTEERVGRHTMTVRDQ